MAWEIDALHSQVRLSIRQLAGTTIRGRFSAVGGYLYIDAQNPAHSWIDVEVAAASVETGDEERDARLRSQDVLDVATYPTITFKSGPVNHVVSQEYRVSGDLTMHGVTRTVTFDVGFLEPNDTAGMEYAGLTATTTLNSQDFGIGGAADPAAGEVATGAMVRIEIDLVLAAYEPGIESSIA